MEPVSLGLLRDDEVEALQELAEAIWRVCYTGLISSGQIDYMLAQRYRPALLRQLLARGDRILVARGRGRLLGFAHAFPIGEGRCKLDKLYVHTAAQRRGIGGRLVGEVERYARARGCAWLMLRVNKRNAGALAAYRRYGFFKVSERVEEIGAGFVMDDDVLAKALGN